MYSVMIHVFRSEYMQIEKCMLARTRSLFKPYKNNAALDSRRQTAHQISRVIVIIQSHHLLKNKTQHHTGMLYNYIYGTGLPVLNRKLDRDRGRYASAATE